MGIKGDRSERIEQLEILKHAVESTNEAFVTIDEKHQVLIFNGAAEKIFGYSRNEVVGHDLDVIMAPTCSQNHRKAVSRYVKTRVPGRIGHETEMTASRKTGEKFPASISFSVTEINGRLFFTGIVRDLTETRALQERILQSERLAALGQLVAEISHEIKNPLMMIGGFARQLMRGAAKEENLKKLRIIESEVKRLEDLLSDLREFYLPKTITANVVNVNKLLQEIKALVKVDCDKKRIQSEWNLEKQPCLLRGHPDRLKQVFLNLVKNAIEAMADGGNLWIKTSLSDGLLVITVADDGDGIPEKVREKIFSPFFTTKEHGTGLGLSISKRIIEEYEGASFTVESEEGKGSIFKIGFPI